MVRRWGKPPCRVPVFDPDATEPFCWLSRSKQAVRQGSKAMAGTARQWAADCGGSEGKWVRRGWRAAGAGRRALAEPAQGAPPNGKRSALSHQPVRGSGARKHAARLHLPGAPAARCALSPKPDFTLFCFIRSSSVLLDSKFTVFLKLPALASFPSRLTGTDKKRSFAKMPARCVAQPA